MWFRFKFISKKWTIYIILLIIICYFCYISIIHIINYILVNRLILISYLKKPTTYKYIKNKTNVIIGHYIGPGNSDRLSKDVVNKNEFSPIPGEGDNGKPVVIPAKDILKMQHLFQINRFNLMASDRIDLNRTLPDVRKKKCQIKEYSENLPTTTIIIVFHNEAWSVLLRTVWSAINRSPKHLLHEIILVDDASEREFLKSELDNYVLKLPIPTKVLRLKSRKGLIAARLLGASHANAEVLTFLDAHCECAIGWLEPLLNAVHENHRTIACPVIDIISDNNFGYIKSFELHWGAFNWQLHFRWYMLSEKELNQRKIDITSSFSTPTMAGGLFSIDKHYFYEMGSYDSKMKIWGGDNLEMSFRIWQCGGNIKIVPCSHVGHLFRKSSPYTFPGGINEVLNENLARTALVWMDDWSNFFLKYNNIPESLYTNLDISERLELRKNLNCNNFKWYLDNVWEEHFFPMTDRFIGKILLVNTKSSLYLNYINLINRHDISADNLKWINLIDYLNENVNDFEQLLYKNFFGFCLQKPQNQGTLNLPYGQSYLKLCGNLTNVAEMFIIKSNGQIITNEGICLDVSDDEENSIVRMVTCTNSDRQKWIYDIKTQQIIQKSTNYCLTTATQKLNHILRNPNDYESNKKHEKFNLIVNVCKMHNNLQKWILIPLNWK